MIRFKNNRGRLTLPGMKVLPFFRRKTRYTTREDLYFEGRKPRWYGFRDFYLLRTRILNIKIQEMK